jgi:hypothetical protein
MYYNRRITTCVKHLSNFKMKHLLHLRILKMLATNKFSNQFHNLSENQESTFQRNLMEYNLNLEAFIN